MLVISKGLGLGSVTKNEVVWVSNNPQHIQKRGQSTYHSLNKKRIDFKSGLLLSPNKNKKMEPKTPSDLLLSSNKSNGKQRWKKKRGLALTPSAASPILSLDVEQHRNSFVCCRDLQILTEVKVIEREGGRGEWIETK